MGLPYSGNDTGKDVGFGGPGNGWILARYNGDTVYAGYGNDTIRLATGNGGGFTMVYVHCGAGYDTVYSPYGG